MNDRTGHFFAIAKNHREQLKRIWADYDAQMQKLEKLKGSVYFDEEAKKAAETRDTAIAAAKTAAAAAFNEILQGMRESANSRPMAAPTSQQLGLVQALKLREKLSRSEIEQAARTLKESPVCLSVLQELAAKNGYMGMRFCSESSESISAHIDSLERAASKIVRLAKPDSRREQVERADVHSANYQPGATSTLLVDRDFQSEEEMLSFLGDVRDICAFRVAVNAD